jgi:hypothetical protein
MLTSSLAPVLQPARALAAAPGAVVAWGANGCAQATVRSAGTDVGTVVVTGNEIPYHNFHVAGTVDGGVLAGSTFTGTQEVRQTQIDGRATVQGSWRATGPAGTLTMHYHVTIAGRGQVTGSVTTHAGTGALADAAWAGTIRGQRVGLDAQGRPTYLVTLSGPCRNLPCSGQGLRSRETPAP